MADGSAALDLSRNLLDDLFSHAHATLIGDDRGLAAGGGGHGHKRKGTDGHGHKRKNALLSSVGEGATKAFGEDTKRILSDPSATNGTSRGRAPKVSCVLPPTPATPPTRTKETVLRVPLRPPPVSLTCPTIPTCLATSACLGKTPCPTTTTCLTKPTCLPANPPRPHRPHPSHRPASAAPSPRKFLRRADAQRPPKPPSSAPPPTTYLTSPPAHLATPPAYMTSATYPVSPDVVTSYLAPLPTYLAQFYSRLTTSAAARLAAHFSSLSSSLSSSPSSSTSSSSSSSSSSTSSLSSPSFSSSFSAPIAAGDDDRCSPKREEPEDELDGRKSCVVCGDHAPSAPASPVCDSCRTFFWRSVVGSEYRDFACAKNWSCMASVSARRACQACSCLRAGMDISQAEREENEDPTRSSHSPHASPSPSYETETKNHGGGVSAFVSRPGGSPCAPSFLGPSEPSESPQLRSSHSTIPLAGSRFRIGHPSSGPRVSIASPNPSVLVAPAGPQRSVITSNASLLDLSSAPIKTEDSLPFKYPERLDPARSVIQNVLGSSSGSFRSPRSQERRKAAPGAASSNPNEAASSRQAGSNATPPLVLNMKDMESLLAPEDYADLKELEESYHRAFENISVPMENRTIKPEELSKLYSSFIKRRANFLVSTSLYSTLAPADRPKLLRIAVSMCTYITGAHLMDTRNYTWPKQGDAASSPATPMLSACTIRQYLSHEQFIHLMRFYVNYSAYYCDERIAIMMQVLSLAYPETGLADPTVVEEGRRRYGGLLSRYLLAVYGPEAGVSMFRALLSSQVEMRQLVEINQHVELVPRVSRQEDANAGAVLNKGIQLVCDGAMEMVDQLMRNRQQGGRHESSLISVLHQSSRSLAAVRPQGALHVDDPERLVVIEDVLRRLALCNDPKLLADARRIIPTDLLKQFHKMLE